MWQTTHNSSCRLQQDAAWVLVAIGVPYMHAARLADHAAVYYIAGTNR